MGKKKKEEIEEVIAEEIPSVDGVIKESTKASKPKKIREEPSLFYFPA